MAARPSAEVTEFALARLMRGCPEGEAFRQEAIGWLRRPVGLDGWCWIRLDAWNRLPAHGSVAGGIGAEAIPPRLFRPRAGWIGGREQLMMWAGVRRNAGSCGWAGEQMRTGHR